MSRVKFNLNDHILIKLTDLGKDFIIKKYGYGYFETIWEREKTGDGYYKVQAHAFMNMFGEHLFNGCKMPCEPTVYFLEEDLEKETMNNKDLTVKTLHKVVDYLINDSAEDICQMCIYINREYQDLPDDVEPCFYKRTNGKVACRNGIIEYFQREIANEERANQKP